LSFSNKSQNAPSLTLEEKRERGDMTLNSKNLSLLGAKSLGSSNDLADVEIDSSVNQYLENNLGIKVHKPGEELMKNTNLIFLLWKRK
jgi:hypothetical protein